MTQENAPAAPAPVVEMRGISIGFPGVKALDGVDFRMFPGEVHSLMGENGAGKSTLIKALTGVYGIDAGTITLAGEQVSFSGPAQAQAAGISTATRGESLRHTHGLTVDGLGAVEILVAETDIERARQLLASAESGDFRLGDEDQQNSETAPRASD